MSFNFMAAATSGVILELMKIVSVSPSICHEVMRLNAMGEFNSDDHYINYHGQESLRRNGVPP